MRPSEGTAQENRETKLPGKRKTKAGKERIKATSDPRASSGSGAHPTSRSLRSRCATFDEWPCASTWKSTSHASCSYAGWISIRS